MSSVFPLPVSNNFKLFQYTFSDGVFTGCTILWPARFVKQSDVINAEHVFILKNKKNEYFHCIWRWNSSKPEMLLKKHWSNCFDKKKHTSISNRYLFNTHSFQLMLPYVPHVLHKHWVESKINRRDDAFVISCFKSYFDLNVFDQSKKRYERFPGWHKKTIKNNLNQYVKYITMANVNEVPINLNINIKDLKPDQKKILDQATALVHAVFPNFCMEIKEQ